MALPIELVGIFLRDLIIFFAIYLIVSLSLNLHVGRKKQHIETTVPKCAAGGLAR